MFKRRKPRDYRAEMRAQIVEKARTHTVENACFELLMFNSRHVDFTESTIDLHAELGDLFGFAEIESAKALASRAIHEASTRWMMSQQREKVRLEFPEISDENLRAAFTWGAQRYH